MTNDTYHRFRRHVRVNVDGALVVPGMARTYVENAYFRSRIAGPASTPVRALQLESELTRFGITAVVHSSLRRSYRADLDRDEAEFTCDAYRDDFIADVGGALGERGVALTSAGTQYLAFSPACDDLLALVPLIVRGSRTFPISGVTITYRRF